jgi:hypothetical protein
MQILRNCFKKHRPDKHRAELTMRGAKSDGHKGQAKDLQKNEMV